MLQKVAPGPQQDAPDAVTRAPEEYEIFKVLERRPNGRWLVAYTGFGNPEVVRAGDVPLNLRQEFIANNA